MTPKPTKPPIVLTESQEAALAFIEARPGYIGRAAPTVRNLYRRGLLEYQSETQMVITEKGKAALAAWRQYQGSL